MRDFNFFQPFLKSNEKKNGTWLYWLVGVLFFAALLGGYQLHLFRQLKSLNSDLETIQIFNTNPTVIKKISQVDKKQVFLSEMDVLVQNVQIMTLAYDLKPNYTDMSMEQISAQIPEGVFIYKAELSPEMLKFTGYSKNYEALSQTVYNLKKISGYENLSLSSVKDMEGQLQFIMESSINSGGSIE